MKIYDYQKEMIEKLKTLKRPHFVLMPRFKTLGGLIREQTPTKETGKDNSRKG